MEEGEGPTDYTRGVWVGREGVMSANEGERRGGADIRIDASKGLRSKGDARKPGPPGAYPAGEKLERERVLCEMRRVG